MARDKVVGDGIPFRNGEIEVYVQTHGIGQTSINTCILEAAYEYGMVRTKVAFEDREHLQALITALQAADAEIAKRTA